EVNDEIFDFRKNKKFINSILKTDIVETLPVIEKDWMKSDNNLNEKYAVFYIGGRTNYKLWKVDNFIKVSKYINEKYRLKIFLLGSKEDVDLSLEFANRFNNQNVKNLTAKTTLIDVIKILNKASIMVGNDSGLAHIAAALNTKLIVIANGTHLGRFFPYPEEATHVKAIYPHEIEAQLKHFSEASEKYKYRSRLDINSVFPEKVINEADNFLR
ncbi:MAG: glycosyltransferase family 9 protein, partial [Ignavibacteriaceae bacterium]